MPAASGFAGRPAGRKESRQQTRSFQPAKKTGKLCRFKSQTHLVLPSASPASGKL